MGSYVALKIVLKCIKKGGFFVDGNICHFVPYRKDGYSLQTVNFVLETMCKKEVPFSRESLYKAYYVTSGSGFLHIDGKKIHLEENDVFFTFPSWEIAITSENDFSYMYVSFLGNRANMIMEKTCISYKNCIFHNCEKILAVWEICLETKEDFADLASESVLLETFAYIGERMCADEKKTKTASDSVSKIKNYIDDNFQSVDFSLDKIANFLNYNAKYISSVFKKSMGMGVVDYLNTIRVQYAVELIDEGFGNVSELAYHCGYKDGAYFSKVFKKKTGYSVGEYKKMKNSQTSPKT